MPIFYLITRLAVSVVNLLEFLLLARAILSWFPRTQDSQITDFLRFTTEPIVAPCRNLLDRVPALRSTPIDFSVLLAFLVLEFLQVMLRYFLLH